MIDDNQPLHDLPFACYLRATVSFDQSPALILLGGAEPLFAGQQHA
jgi:hypothetical protein